MLDTFHLTLEFTPVEAPDDPYAERTGTQDYVVQSGSNDATIVVKWNQALFEDLAALREPGRDPALVQAMGDRLRRLIAPSGWQRNLAKAAEASAEGQTVVLTFRSRAAEIFQLPWELMTLQSGRHLGALDNVLFRYELGRTQTIPRVTTAEGGRIVFAWSAAGGRVPAERHQQLLADACRRGDHPFEPSTDVATHVTLEGLATLIASPDVAVLHLLAHGAEAGGSAYGLAVDAADGGQLVLDPGRMRELVAPHADHLRLVVLCACDSGNAGVAGNPLGSVAQALHGAGVEAVIASRYPLSVEGAALLTEALYDGLLGGPMSVETALLKAQRRLLAESASLDWASIQLYVRADDGHDTRPVTIRPFRGLLAYQPRDARFFFGRDGERTELLSDLEALRAEGKPRFLVVAGASGTGKSSMVLAGAVPDLLGHQEAAYNRDESVRVEQIIEALRRLLPTYDPPAVRQSLDLLVQLSPGARSSVSGWRYLVFRPGAHPIDALEETIGELNVQQGPVLLIVDQFEEIFAQCDDPQERETFAQRLWSFARLADADTHVIITIRVDYLGQCGDLVIDEAGTRLDRVAYDEAHRVFVAQMGLRQLRAAIEEPAHKVGLELEPGLVERMLADVEGEPGALPLLSYTLDLLWQSRNGRVLTQAAYDELGGVAGALHQRADYIIAHLTSELARHQARRMLVRLVAVEDGAWDARRRVRIAELRPSQLLQMPAFGIALESLVSARLLVRGQEGRHPTIELAHEALIRRWTRLREWIVADQQMLAQVKTVERWTEEWRRFRRLLEGDQLGYAAQVSRDFDEELSEDARTLIRESEMALHRSQTRRRRLTIGFMGFAVVTALVMLALGIWGLTQKSEADANAEDALARYEEAIEKSAGVRIATQVSAARGLEYGNPLLASLFLMEFAGSNGADAVDDPQSIEAVPPGGLPLARRLASRPVPVRRLGRAQVVRDDIEPTLAFARTGEVLTAVNGIARLHGPRSTRRLQCGEGGFTVVQASLASDGNWVPDRDTGRVVRPVLLVEERTRGRVVERRMCAVTAQGAPLALPMVAGLPRPARISIDAEARTASAIWPRVDCDRAALAATTIDSVSAAIGHIDRVAAVYDQRWSAGRPSPRGGRGAEKCALVGRWTLGGEMEAVARDDFLCLPTRLMSYDVDPTGRRAVLLPEGEDVEQLDLAGLETVGCDAAPRPSVPWRVPFEHIGRLGLTGIRYARDGHRIIGTTGTAAYVWGEPLARPTLVDGPRVKVQPAGVPALLENETPIRPAVPEGTRMTDFTVRDGASAFLALGEPSRLVVHAPTAGDRDSSAVEPVDNIERLVLVDGVRPRVGLLRRRAHWQFKDVEFDSLLNGLGRELDGAGAPQATAKAKAPALPAWPDDQPVEAEDESTNGDRNPKAGGDGLPEWPEEDDDADDLGLPPPVKAGRPALRARATVSVEACVDGVQQVALDPTDRYLLVITATEVCLVPTTAEGRLRRLPVRGALQYAFRADGRYVALLAGDGSSAIWAVEPDSPRALAADGIERIWFPETGEEPPILYGLDRNTALHRWRMSDDVFENAELPPIPDVVAYAPNGRWLVTDTAAIGTLTSPYGDGPPVKLARYRPDRRPTFSDSGGWLVQSVGVDVQLWAVPSGQRVVLRRAAPTGAAPDQDETLESVVVAPDDRHVAVLMHPSGESDLRLVLWDLERPERPLDEVAVPGGSSAIFTLDSARIVVTGKRSLSIRPVRELHRSTNLQVPVTGGMGVPVISPDGRYIVAGVTDDGPVRLLAWSLDGKDDAPRTIGAEHVADGTSDGVTKGWVFAARIQTKNGGEVTTDRPHLLFRSTLGTIERRRLDRFGLDGALLGHAEVVESMVYHPAGRMVTRDKDDEVRLWLARADSGADGFLRGRIENLVLDDGTADIEQTLFSPEGDWLVAQTRHGTLWTWRLGWVDLMRHLRARTDECLSADERVQHLGGRWDDAQAEAAACLPPRAR